uniref:RAD51 associated protein 2 n=1 Tax=Nannospalax galili TaxID=1026970 RepID=A0A8C6QFF2_NANGA
MSVTRPPGPVSEPRPADSAPLSPPGKRPRLEELGGVSEAGYRLLLVPRLSEVEKAWEWSPRPFAALLVPLSAAFGEWESSAPAFSSARAGSSTARDGACDPGRRDDDDAPGLRPRGGLGAEAGRLPHHALTPDVHVADRPREEPVRRERGRAREDCGSPPALVVTSAEKNKPPGAELARTADSSADPPSPVPRTPLFPNPLGLGGARPGRFRPSITVTVPEFRADLHSNMPSVYLKQAAKKKNGKFVAYVRDFTNIDSSQNRPDAKKRKLQHDKKPVVEKVFSDYDESNPQSPSNQNNFWGKKDLISLNCYHYSSMTCDVKGSKENFTITPENSKLKRAERSLKVYVSPTPENSQSWDYNRSGILSKCLQNKILEYLNVIPKTNIAPLLSNFDSFIRSGHGWESEEGSIFQWIVHLNYSKNIVTESHIVYVAKSLTFLGILEDNRKHVPKKRKLFKTEQVLEGAKNQNISFLITTKSLPGFETYENVPVLMDFDNIREITLTRESSNVNASCPAQLNVDNWAHYSFSTVKTQVKSGPQFTQNNCGYSSGKCYKISKCNQDLDTERKQRQKGSRLNFKFMVEDAANLREMTTLSSPNKMHHEQMNSTAIIQKLNFEKLLDEGKIWELKVIKSLSRCQVQKDFEIEEEEDSFPLMYGMCSMQSVSVMSKKVNVEETKSANQDDRADTKEFETILQDSELANSKHFHPKNDSTSYVNHQFENDSSEESNECFQGLTANCLSTETLTIAKDFEMKSKFDLVLEELRMFHEISKENEIPSNVEMNNRKENHFGESNDIEETKMEIEKELKLVETNKTYTSFLHCDMKAGPNKHKIYQGLFRWKTIPNNGGQEVPNEYCCPRSEEHLLCSTPEEDCKKPLPQRPAFSPDGCKGEKYNYLLRGGGISRIQPLKTCNRPIRVGLSRKARPKQLHPHLK